MKLLFSVSHKLRNDKYAIASSGSSRTGILENGFIFNAEKSAPKCSHTFPVKFIESYCTLKTENMPICPMCKQEKSPSFYEKLALSIKYIANYAKENNMLIQSDPPVKRGKKEEETWKKLPPDAYTSDFILDQLILNAMRINERGETKFFQDEFVNGDMFFQILTYFSYKDIAVLEQTYPSFAEFIKVLANPRAIKTSRILVTIRNFIFERASEIIVSEMIKFYYGTISSFPYGWGKELFFKQDDTDIGNVGKLTAIAYRIYTLIFHADIFDIPKALITIALIQFMRMIAREPRDPNNLVPDALLSIIKYYSDHSKGIEFGIVLESNHTLLNMLATNVFDLDYESFTAYARIIIENVPSKQITSYMAQRPLSRWGIRSTCSVFCSLVTITSDYVELAVDLIRLIDLVHPGALHSNARAAIAEELVGNIIATESLPDTFDNVKSVIANISRIDANAIYASYPLLFIANSTGDFKSAKLLLELGADPNVVYEDGPWRGPVGFIPYNQPLHHPLDDEDIEGKDIVAYFAELFNRNNPYALEPMALDGGGDTIMVNAMVSFAGNKWEGEVLPEVVDILSRVRGLDVVHHKNHLGLNTVDYAYEFRNPNIILSIYENTNARTLRDSKGRIAIMHMIKDPEFVHKILASKYEDPNTVDDENTSVIGWAISGNAPASLRLLLKYGADPNAAVSGISYPMDLAMSNEKLSHFSQMLDILLEHMAGILHVSHWGNMFHVMFRYGFKWHRDELIQFVNDMYEHAQHGRYISLETFEKMMFQDKDINGHIAAMIAHQHGFELYMTWESMPFHEQLNAVTEVLTGMNNDYRKWVRLSLYPVSGVDKEFVEQFFVKQDKLGRTAAMFAFEKGYSGFDIYKEIDLTVSDIRGDTLFHYFVKSLIVLHETRDNTVTIGDFFDNKTLDVHQKNHAGQTAVSFLINHFRDIPNDSVAILNIITNK